MLPRMTLVTGAHTEGWSRVGGTSFIKRCLWASLQSQDQHFFSAIFVKPASAEGWPLLDCWPSSGV